MCVAHHLWRIPSLSPRLGKNTLWEGGTRVNGIVRGAGIVKTDYVSFEKYHGEVFSLEDESIQSLDPLHRIHPPRLHLSRIYTPPHCSPHSATDWLPTLVSMASGRNWTDFTPPGEPPHQAGDGMDVWASLSTGGPSPRDWLLLEAHPTNTTGQGHGDALIIGDWKVIRWWLSPNNGWFPPPGQNPATTNYSLSCGAPPPPTPQQCHNVYCLFNVTADPCEHTDLAAAHPDVVASMVAALAVYQATAVPPTRGSGCAPVRVPLPGGGGEAYAPCDA